MADEETTETVKNPLGTRAVGSLLLSFSVPSVIALLVNSLYNVIDQVFIGNYVGELGNAATNIAFPFTILCLSLGLLFGIGGAAAFNLAMGRGERQSAPFFIGNSAVTCFLCGIVIMIITLIFLTPLLRLFGSPDDVLPYAQIYVFITAFGFPFQIFETAAGHLIRADGRPTASMVVIVSGAVLDALLDALFVAAFGWGMEGASISTVISLIVSAGIGLWYLAHPKTVKITRHHLRPQGKYVGHTARLGIAPCLNQLSMMVVQITMNNTLETYGALSIYGSTIPIAVVGIITKVSQVFNSINIGIGQGMQPIASYNYGAKNYSRVRSAFTRCLIAGFVVGIITFLLFQLFPRQIISIFGEGSSELYYEFAVSYFRIFLMLAFINFLPQMVSTFFTAMGKPVRGTILSLTRQIIFFLPLLVIFPMIWGIDGVMYVGPVADGLAVVVSIIMLVTEFRDLSRREIQAAKLPLQDETAAEVAQDEIAAEVAELSNDGDV